MSKQKSAVVTEEYVIQALLKAQVLSFDTEGTSLFPKESKLLGFSMACADPADPRRVIGWYWSFDPQAPKDLVSDWGYIKDTVLKPVLEDPKRTVAMHNAKYDIFVMKYRGIQVKAKVRDTMIMSFYYNENNPKGLKELAKQFLGVKKALTFKQTEALMASFEKDAVKQLKAWSNEAWDYYKEHRKSSDVDVVQPDSLPAHLLPHMRVAALLKPKMLKRDVQAEVYAALEEHTLNAAVREKHATFSDYATKDAVYTFKLYRIFWKQFKQWRDDGTADYFAMHDDMEFPISMIAGYMNDIGTYVDIPAVECIDKALELVERAVEFEVKQVFPAGVNVASPSQLQKFFWEDLKCTPPKWAKVGKNGQPSTNADVMEYLGSKGVSAAEVLVRMRGVRKQRSTYTKVLLEQNRNSRIHAFFHTLGAATGRWSSSDPNLQNQPGAYKMPVTRPIKVKGYDRDNPPPGFVAAEIGGKKRWRVAPLRSVYRATPGYKLISCDLSQIELRVMAHVSGDPALKDAYTRWDCAECGRSGHTHLPLHACPNCGAPDGKRDKNHPDQPAIKGFCLGLDLHSKTAVTTPLIDLYPDLSIARNFSKPFNFGLIYGREAKAIAKELGIDVDAAAAIRSAWFDTYAGVKDYHHWIEANMRERGWVPIMSGRRRSFERERDAYLAGGLKEYQWQEHIRTAYNVPIQGGAGDIMKMATIGIAKEFEERWGFANARPLIQVHDELLLEARDGIVEDAFGVVKHHLENSVHLSVPILAEGAYGDGSWHDYH